MQPLVDILVPTYEPNPDHLRKAIESAIRQTETRWRMRIRDDASTIDVRPMIAAFLDDERISFEQGIGRLGIGGNWNACIGCGRAPYVQFLFQDDYWEPTLLERGLSVMEKEPDVGIVSFRHDYAIEGDQSIAPMYREHVELRDALVRPGKQSGREALLVWLDRGLHPNIVGEPDFTMLRRSVLEQSGPYLTDMSQNLDVEMAVRMLQHGNWYVIDEPLGTFRVHESGASAKNRKAGKGLFDRFRCLEHVIRDLPRSDRPRAIAARNRALTGMALNFLRRIRHGGSVKGDMGSSSFWFVARHPVLMGFAFVRAIAIIARDRIQNPH